MNTLAEADLYERMEIDIGGPAAYFPEDPGFEDMLAFLSSEGFESSEIMAESAESRIPDEWELQASMEEFI